MSFVKRIEVSEGLTRIEFIGGQEAWIAYCIRQNNRAVDATGTPATQKKKSHRSAALPIAIRGPLSYKSSPKF